MDATTTTTRTSASISTRGARCRFAPDSEEENTFEEDSNAERVRNLGEKVTTVTQEDDQDDDWLDGKKPAQTTKKTTKKAQIAEGKDKARAWAAERAPNPTVHSSPANLKAVQERKQAEKQKKGGK